MLACIFGFWTALGVNIAWHKVERRTGARSDVELAAHIQDRYVEVVIPEKKVKELKEATVQLLSKTMVTVRALTTNTGHTNWASPPEERPPCQCWCGCRRRPGRG